MSRRSLDETRQLLLDVGLHCLYQRGVSVGVTHVKLNDVVAAAGLTTGAAYRCWDNQEAFHHDLAVAAMRWRDRHSIAATVDGIRDLVDRRAPWREVVRAGAAANLESFRNDPSFVTSIALRVSAQFDDALERAGKDRLDTALSSFADLYGGLLKLYERRMRAPFTLEHFTMMIAALSEGFVLQMLSGMEHPHVELDSGDPDVGSTWTLMAAAVDAFVTTFTEPDTGRETGHEPTPSGTGREAWCGTAPSGVREGAVAPSPEAKGQLAGPPP